MKNILDKLSQHLELSDEIKIILADLIVQLNLKKGTLLLQGGEICQNIYFIEKGFARGFFYKNGKEITSWFALENDIATSFYSFETQKPNFENIEILENSIFYALSYQNLHFLYHRYPEFNMFGRKLVEKYYIELMERTFSFQFQSAHERYQQILTQHPQILKRATLGHVASYLGISQETLSRIRAKK